LGRNCKSNSPYESYYYPRNINFGFSGGGVEKFIDRIVAISPAVVSLNVEAVRRFAREVRIQAKYDRSLGVLKHLKD
jgi:lipoate synthase